MAARPRCRHCGAALARIFEEKQAPDGGRRRETVAWGFAGRGFFCTMTCGYNFAVALLRKEKDMYDDVDDSEADHIRQKVEAETKAKVNVVRDGARVLLQSVADRTVSVDDALSSFMKWLEDTELTKAFTEHIAATKKAMAAIAHLKPLLEIRRIEDSKAWTDCVQALDRMYAHARKSGDDQVSINEDYYVLRTFIGQR